MNEIPVATDIVKCYAWENIVLVQAIRNGEFNWIVQ
jgi:hypothetical protein